MCIMSLERINLLLSTGISHVFSVHHNRCIGKCANNDIVDIFHCVSAILTTLKKWCCYDFAWRNLAVKCTTDTCSSCHRGEVAPLIVVKIKLKYRTNVLFLNVCKFVVAF